MPQDTKFSQQKEFKYTYIFQGKELEFTYFSPEDFKDWPKAKLKTNTQKENKMSVSINREGTQLTNIGAVRCNGSSVICYVNSNPTNNCQLFTIASFMTALVHDDFKKIVKECHKFAEYKKLLLVDIPRGSIPKLKEYFQAEDIVFEQEYKSTSGSLMTVVLLKTQAIIGWP